MKKKIILCLFIFISSYGPKVFSEQPVDSILVKAMKAAESYSDAIEKYDAEIYMRLYVNTLKKNFLYQYTHLIPNFVLHNRDGSEGMIEVLSNLTFNYPNNYTIDIQHLFTTFPQKKLIDMLPTNLIHLNVYSEMSSNERFFMPIREASKKYYRYSLENTFVDNGMTFYTISFTPIYKAPKLLQGVFVIEKDSWRVMQFVCEGVDFAADFSIELNMGNSEATKLLPVNGTIHQKFSYLGNVVSNRNLIDIIYRTISLNDKRPKAKNLNISNLYKVRLDSVPVKDDPVFWENARKIPLQAREKDLLNQFYLDQSKEKNNKLMNDSLNSKKREANQWTKTMVTNTRYKYRSADINYGGVFNPALLGYSSFDGLTYGQKLNIKYELKRQSSINMRAFAGYLFRRKEFFADLSTTWNYNPVHLGNLTLSIGKGNESYSSMFLSEVQDSLKNQGLKLDNLELDYYKDYYISLYNTVEIKNGFSIGTGIDYHIRDAANKRVDASASATPFAKTTAKNYNISKMFGRQNTFAPLITLTWTPEQFYRFERRQKIYVRSPYPTIKLEFSKALKGVLGSHSQYNRVEFDISQNIQLALMKSFQYHIGMGFFSNQKSDYFTDFKYFARRNFPETWDDGIGGVFNLLDRQLYNASDSYIQSHFMFESPFLVLNLVPILSKGVITERLYYSHLYNPYIRSYSEIGYGFGNNYFNAAFFGSLHKLKFNELGFKISLNIFN
ncbi:MAG TPA: DUF5686 family protein [Dysgonamonadaceae bacterium]|nr:DUF5686 family protein [Dysgonamonadaceae bacterium]